MFPGGRAPDPRRMKAMMRKMGIEQTELAGVERVVIVTRDRELVFDAPEVTAVTAQGQTTYQVSGQPVERPRGAPGSGEGAGAGASAADGAGMPAAARPKYTGEDVALVVAQTGVTEASAREALDACDGEVAEAIIRLIG